MNIDDFWRKIQPDQPTWQIKYLFKLGKHEHLEQLRDEGLVYLNPLSFFQKLECDPHRADEYEGLSFIDHNVSEIRIGDHAIPGKDILELKGTLDLPCHVFCLFGIINRDGKYRLPLFDRRIYEDGEWDTAAVIEPPFIKRLLEAVHDEIQSLLHELQPEVRAWGLTPVEYVDLHTYNGVVGPFRKDRRFAYQNECRFILPAGNNEPRIIRLGSMKDCVHLVPTKDLPESLSIPLNTDGDEQDDSQCSQIKPVEIDGFNTDTIFCIGDANLIWRPATGFFCSQKCPGDRIIKLYDLARHWRDTGEPIIGGFHSPMEKEVLDILLKGTQPIIVCPARSIHHMRVPAKWRKAIDEGRLLILSPFDEGNDRITSELACRRNEFVAAIADNVFVAHAEHGGSVEALTTHLKAAGKPVRGFDDE